MLVKTLFRSLLAVCMAATSMAQGGPLPISYGKCYRIQTEDRRWLGNRGSVQMRWDYPLKHSYVYQICQHRVDGSCEYDAVRPVQTDEEYFLYDFIGFGEDNRNLLAAPGPGSWFYSSWWGFKNFFHFQGQKNCRFGTTPCAIQTGGHDAAGHDEPYRLRGITNYWGRHGEKSPIATTKESRVPLWYHEVDCPEEE